MRFQPIDCSIYKDVIEASSSKHIMSQKSLSERRNFKLKFNFNRDFVPYPTSDEGTPTPSPTKYVPFSCPTSDEGTPPPTKRRKIGDDEKSNAGKEEAVESGEEEAVQLGEEEGAESDEEEAVQLSEEGGASPPWCGVREKYLQYDVPYVEALGEDDLPHLHQLGRWYFPNSCPRTQEEWDYVEGVRNAVYKRLLQLKCNCSDCQYRLELVPDEELLDYL